eukprot:scaffold70184_cov35-Tisochrysis_lutea.AAC.2
MPYGAGVRECPNEPEKGTTGVELATSSPECTNQSTMPSHPGQGIASESRNMTMSSDDASRAPIRSSHRRSVPCRWGKPAQGGRRWSVSATKRHRTSNAVARVSPPGSPY